MDKKKQNFNQLLGEAFSDSERETLLQENPILGEESDQVFEAWQALRAEPIPMMNPHFTHQLNEKLQAQTQKGKPSKGRAWLYWLFGGLSLTAAFSLLLVLGLPLLLKQSENSFKPGILISAVHSSDQNSMQDPAYEVRFTLSALQAKSVTIMGDFSAWQKIPLERTASGNFTLKMKLSSGTYAYGFYIDGKKWVLDPHAHATVPDGFGNYNSMIQL